MRIQRLARASATARFLAAGAAGLMTALAAAPPARAADRPIAIAFVSGPLSDSFFPPVYAGAQDAAKALGVKLNYISIDETDIEASSARTMQVAIAQKPDAIVVGDFVTSVVDPFIKQAIAAGIPVYVDQSGQDQWAADGAFGFVGQQGPEVGAVASRRLAQSGARTVLCVINVPGNPYLHAICRGLAAEAAKHGQTSQDLELPSADSNDQAKVSRDIGAFLQSHKQIDGIFTENAAIGTAATAALDAAQLDGKVHVGTMEISKIALQQVHDGKIDFLINEQPYLDGYYGVLFATQYARYGLAPVGPVSTGPSVVDKTNIARITRVFDTYPNVIGSR